MVDIDSPIVDENDAKMRYLRLRAELENFAQIQEDLIPRLDSIPKLKGIDMHANYMQLNGRFGGDHLVFVDFAQMYDLEARIERALQNGRQDLAEQLRLNAHRVGIMIADVQGHQITDSALAGQLHQAFLLGIPYELELHGQVTTRLFEGINDIFHRSTEVMKFLTMIYGEVWDDGRFRYISAGHPAPLVFSKEYGRFMNVDESLQVTFEPIGLLPSLPQFNAKQDYHPEVKEEYHVNEIRLLGHGDILFLYSDGVSEHMGAQDARYFPRHLEALFQEHKDLSAEDICYAIQENMLAYGKPSDDVSYVVVKKE